MLPVLFVWAAVATFVETELIMRSRFFFVVWYAFTFVALHAQEDYFPPYYPTLSGTGEYAAWHVTYPDSLLRTDTPGEAVCTVRIDTLGRISSKQITASHPLFAEAAEKVLNDMTNWQPAQRDGRVIDTTLVIRIPFDPDAYRERIWRQQQILEPCRGQVVDTKPLFPDNIRKLILGNMTWPDPKVQSAVAVCRFTVNEEGHIENARVLKGTHPAFDKEALRILSEFPRLIPAKKDGKYVPFDYFLTMNFWKLDLEYYLRYREKARQDLKNILWEPYTYSIYPGGSVALSQFINSHLRITPEMKATRKQGRVIYSFDIDIDGSMKNFKLVRGLHPLMDAEALRVLRLVDQKWSTGYYFNSEKWYREFCGNQFAIPVIFQW